MRGWALTIVLAMAMVGALGSAVAAQSRWKQPNDLFSLHLPAGWSINESEENRWTLRPMDERTIATGDAPVGCMLQLNENLRTMFRPQAELDRMLESPEFAQVWRRSVADVVEDGRAQTAARTIHGLRFLQIVADGRLRDPRRRGPAVRGVVLMALALAPGQFWRLTCVMMPDNPERAVAAVDAMVGSLRIHDTTGATNAR